MHPERLPLRESHRARAAHATPRIPAGALVLAGVVALAGFSGTLQWAQHLRVTALRAELEAARGELASLRAQLGGGQARLDAQVAQTSADLEAVRLDLAAQQRRLADTDPLAALSVWRREADTVVTRVGLLQESVERLEQDTAAWRAGLEQRVASLRESAPAPAVAVNVPEASGPATTIALPLEVPPAVASPVLDGEP